ncbi:hypothetical protein SEMRO_2614_G332660.1 [Seminavis robusta]|uniref:Uncharacterized protein n=1 Tax=Seminavis robusta TaxID=568900 RepID=A0A9N8EZK5_9STRA|nr:hypothetical protein SEMRO_2614_G332660.1 [Seminavis robusta]|eukprot:Sro2614_g332660.1 n/a (202) ;mRNA; r:2849-3454
MSQNKLAKQIAETAGGDFGVSARLDIPTGMIGLLEPFPSEEDRDAFYAFQSNKEGEDFMRRLKRSGCSYVARTLDDPQTNLTKSSEHPYRYSALKQLVAQYPASITAKQMFAAADGCYTAKGYIKSGDFKGAARALAEALRQDWMEANKCVAGTFLDDDMAALESEMIALYNNVFQAKGLRFDALFVHVFILMYRDDIEGG